ncbi:dipeptidase [Sporosarcina sp. NCCP-2716]|uniref:M24 family metallopeptidase n=1 Tax=Sporosarcina sp. NCCP-2716 TaxID=2943679 RepID=UPI002041E741|nr:Xaa-Pro peptidase family protein [Sporosarcina sp. NCCP-2716]GKV69257.1 dipeptidase [Sporosarcina sp. NCCP-2716]
MTTMYENRRAALRSHLQENGYAAGLITDPANVFYFTGFHSDPHERFLGLFVEAAVGKTVLFTPALDKEAAQQSSDVPSIVPISDEQLWFDVIRETVGTLSGKVGIEAKAVSFYRYNELRGAFPEAEAADVQPFVNSLRKRKTREEIEAMRKPIEIIERVLEEGTKLVKVGMTESELTAELEYLMRKFGADGPSFSSIVLSGEKAALPHGEPGERKLRNGDYLLIDFGVAKDGYVSDTTRTFIIGEATERQQLIYDTVLASNQAGIQAVRAGRPVKEFDIAARSVIIDAGFGDYFNNRVGHGLGIEVHEEPSIHQNNEEIAEPGLVFTIEPGIYIPDEGGVRIEDTVYINEQGEAEVLSTFPRELRILG